MTERLLLIAAAGFVSGIGVRSFFMFGMPIVGFGMILVVILFAGYFVHHARSYALAGAFILFLLIGILRVGMVSTEASSELRSRVGTSVTLTGVVTSDPDIRETTQRVRVKTPEADTVLVVTDRYPKLRYGDTVSVGGTLTEPEPFDTLGGRQFDYPKFLAKEGIFLVIQRAHVVPQKISVAFTKVPLRMLYEVRHVFEAGISRALPEPSSSLALGILTGGKQGLGKKLLDAFTVAGLLPIVVLSGYNVMIVAEAVLRGFRFMPKRLAIGLALLTIVLFVLAAGSGSSAVRAGLAACVALFARATGRTYHALRILVAVFVLMLVIHPSLLLYDPGFQFSFIATLGLIVGAPLLVPRLLWLKPAWLRETVATTIAAQVFVLPLLLYETGMLSVAALPANILVLPVIPLAMLLSFLAGLVGVVATPLGLLAGLPAYGVLSYVIWIAETTAKFPVASVTVSVFPIWVVLLLYAGIAVGVMILKRNPLTLRA